MAVRTIPRRRPRHGFGDVLVDRHGFRGRVNMMFADFDAVLAAGVVSDEWFDIQTVPPSSKDQVFYSLVGDGAVLAGEHDVRREEEEWRPPGLTERNGRR